MVIEWSRGCWHSWYEQRKICCTNAWALTRKCGAFDRDRRGVAASGTSLSPTFEGSVTLSYEGVGCG